MARDFDVVVQRDAAGHYVASVPAIPGCHTQAKSLDKLLVRAKEAIQVSLEAQGEPAGEPEFIGIQRILV